MNQGDTFTSFEELREAITGFEQKELVKLYCSDCKKLTNKSLGTSPKVLNANPGLVYAYLTYKCVHGGVFKKRGAGCRTTKSLKQDCPFSLRIKLSGDSNSLVISTLNNEHNHPVSSDVFNALPQQRKLDPNKKEEIRSLLNQGYNRKLLKSYIKATTGKDVLLKYISNLKCHRPERKQKPIQATIQYLQSVEGAIVKVIGEENDLEGIYFQTPTMQRAFSAYPELLLMETLRNSVSSTSLYLLQVINGNGQSEIACSFVITRESTKIVEQMLDTFKSNNPEYERTEAIFTDKEFKEKLALHKELPNAQLSLCVYHALAAFRRVLAQMDLSKEQRSSAMRVLENIAYATSEEEYKSHYLRLCELKFDELIVFYNQNWHHSRCDWVKGLSSRNKISSICTTNDLDALNGKLKQVLLKHTSMFDFFNEFVGLLDTLHAENRTIAINMMVAECSPANVGPFGPFGQKYAEYLTPVAFRFVAAELEKVSTVEGIPSAMDTSHWNCECAFYVNTSLPCRHMFFKRMQEGVPLFSESLVPEKYSKLYHYRHFTRTEKSAPVGQTGGQPVQPDRQYSYPQQPNQPYNSIKSNSNFNQSADKQLIQSSILPIQSENVLNQNSLVQPNNPPMSNHYAQFSSQTLPPMIHQTQMEEAVSIITIDQSGQTSSTCCEILDAHQKYRKAMALCETLCQSLAQMESGEFFDKIEKLATFEVLVNEGKNFAVREVEGEGNELERGDAGEETYVSVVYE